MKAGINFFELHRKHLWLGVFFPIILCFSFGLFFFSFDCDFELYRAGTAGILARTWCHKLQWHLNAEFGATSSSGYAEPMEFSLLAQGASTPHAVKRVIDICNLL